MRAKSRKCADAEAVTPPPPDVAGSRAVRRLPGVPPAAARTGARKTGRGRFERAARVAVPSAPGSIRDESKNIMFESFGSRETREWRLATGGSTVVLFLSSRRRSRKTDDA